MNRDMDLVRDILLRVEADPKMNRDNVGTLKIEDFPGRTHQEMSFHLTILIEVGLIAAPSRGLSRPLVVSGLTWTGCELLDDIRDPEVWKKTKEGAKAVGSFSLDTLRALAKGFIRKQAERLTGIDIDL